MGKYIRLNSLTWWSAFVPLVAGVIVATAPLHGWTAGVDAIRNVTGGIPAAAMINGGLAGIGIRGALK